MITTESETKTTQPASLECFVDLNSLEKAICCGVEAVTTNNTITDGKLREAFYENFGEEKRNLMINDGKRIVREVLVMDIKIDSFFCEKWILFLGRRTGYFVESDLSKSSNKTQKC